jgi:hypothetical protein
MSQPNLSNVKQGTAAIAGSQYDNMSDEDLQALINAAHKVKTGRQGRVGPIVEPPRKQHVDIDALIKQYGGK